MHSYRRARGKILFEVFCALGLAASFAGAWDETGSSALLASASVMALFALYWSFGLFSSDRSDRAAQPAAAVAHAREAEIETAVADAFQAEVETTVREEIVAFEPEVTPAPEPPAAAPKKPRARKTRKAAADVAPVVEQPEPAALTKFVSDGPPIEQLFEPQPYVRQPRPAFGRRARGPRTLPAA